MMELTSTYILLQGLQYHAFIGVGEQEQVVGNDYVLDLRLGYPFAAAMKSDAVDDTLNYADVFNVVSEVMKQPSKLLEAAAGKIVKELCARYKRLESIEKIDIDIAKINPPMGADCDCAGVELHLINDKTKD